MRKSDLTGPKPGLTMPRPKPGLTRLQLMMPGLHLPRKNVKSVKKRRLK